MKRLLPALALLAGLPAWAVGEHIEVTGPAREQLSETLCISMECGTGAHDYTVSSKVVGEQMELKVIGSDGAPRLILKSALNPAGRMASSDVMTAASQLVRAIEAPLPANADVAPPAKKPVKVVKRHVHAPVRVASRMRARG